MQEDNAPWYTAKIVRKYLSKQKVKRLHWPAQSPDLSLIENFMEADQAYDQQKEA